MIMRRLLVAVVATVAASIAMAGCGDTTPGLADLGCRSASDCIVVRLGETIPLGVLVDESDAIGKDTQRSARLAIDYLDGSFDGTDGLLLGHPVALAVEPEFCTPAGGVAGAKRLLLDPDLVAVLGTTCSGAAYQAAATVLSQAKVLMVSPSNTSPKLTDPTEHERFYFRTSFNDLVQGAVVADFARDRLSATRAATVFTGDAYSKLLGETFTRAFASAGGRLAAARQVSATAPVKPTVDAFAAAKPSVIFVPMFEPPCSSFVRALRASPALRDVPIIVSEACQSRAALKALGPAGPGVFASGPDYGDLRVNRFYAESFLPAYKDRYGESPLSVFHATAYDATNLVFSAIRRSSTELPGGTLVINREAMRQAMIQTQGYEGISGTLSCLPTGDCDPSTRIAVYRAPAWPPADADAKPVFSQRKALADVIAAG